MDLENPSLQLLKGRSPQGSSSEEIHADWDSQSSERTPQFGNFFEQHPSVPFSQPIRKLCISIKAVSDERNSTDK